MDQSREKVITPEHERWPTDPFVQELWQQAEKIVPAYEATTTLAQALRESSAGSIDWLSQLRKLRRGRMLDDDVADALMRWSELDAAQLNRLVLADRRAQLRSRRRRVSWDFPLDCSVCDVVVVSAQNYDQTISLPTYRSSAPGESGRSEIEDVSVETEVWVPTEPEFLRRVAALTAKYGTDFTYDQGGSGTNVARNIVGLRPETRVAVVGVNAKPPRGAMKAKAPGAAPSPLQPHRDELREDGVLTDLLFDSTQRGGRCASVVQLNGVHVRRVMVTWPGANAEWAGKVGEHLWDVIDQIAESKVMHITSLFDEESPDLIADVVGTGSTVVIDAVPYACNVKTQDVRIG